MISASNGKEALEETIKEKPAVVVIDISMPVMGGIEYLIELRKIENYSDVPVILMSTNSHKKPNEAYAIIKKPFDANHLLATIREAIEKNPNPYPR